MSHSQVSKTFDLVAVINRIRRRKILNCQGRIITGQSQKTLMIECPGSDLDIVVISKYRPRLAARLFCLLQVTGPQMDQAAQVVPLRLALQKPD